MGKKAPIPVALSEQIEETKPKEKEAVDISVIVDYYLSLLSEEDFIALCRLACMPFGMLISLLQVMNNPGVKESVAHLPTWKQAQFGLRQFCIRCIPSKFWSKRDKEIWDSLCGDSTQRTSEENDIMHNLSVRRRVHTTNTYAWFSRHWDKGVGDRIWFIENDWINYWFFKGKNIFDPTITYEGQKDYWNDYIFYDSSYDDIKEILENKEALAEQEICLHKVDYLRYCLETNRVRYSCGSGSCNSMTDSSVSIPPAFVPTKYEHLAESSGYLKAKYLIPAQYKGIYKPHRPIPSPVAALRAIDS